MWKYPVALLCLLLVIFSSCRKNTTNIEPVEEETSTAVQVDPLRVRAAEIASKMSDNLLVSQLFISGMDGRRYLPSHMIEIFTECPPGGVMLFKYNLDTDNDSIRGLLSQTSDFIAEQSGIKPFIAVDHEGETVNRFLPGVATLPSARDYYILFQHQGNKTLEIIEADSFKAAQELFDLGINMNFAPVAEVLVGGNYDFMRYRSFGPDPSFVSSASLSFMKGMKRAGILCVPKHFPASAGFDPHYSLSVINSSISFLFQLISPFYGLADPALGDARAVMVAHTAVPALDDKIASLSSVIMNGWLRNILWFTGIIICDDFSMAAAGDIHPEEAAVRSVIAGADMILVWPPDLRRTHRAFIEAVYDGRLKYERLHEAASRVIYEKLRMGLME